MIFKEFLATVSAFLVTFLISVKAALMRCINSTLFLFCLSSVFLGAQIYPLIFWKVDVPFNVGDQVKQISPAHLL